MFLGSLWILCAVFFGAVAINVLWNDYHGRVPARWAPTVNVIGMVFFAVTAFMMGFQNIAR